VKNGDCWIFLLYFVVGEAMKHGWHSTLGWI